jgi:DNA-binding beta-propeller fold protein YncE
MSRETLYVTNGNSDNISVFTVEAGGGLELVASVETPDRPRGIVFTGAVAHVVNSGVRLVSTYRVGPGGELTPLGRAVQTDTDPFGIAASPHGDAVYVTSLEDKTVSAFPVRDDGTLAPAAASVVVGDGSLSPRGVAVSTDGRYVFVGTGDPGDDRKGHLTTFAVGVGHRLERRSAVELGPGAFGVGVSPDGRFLYVACAGNDEIRPFRIGIGGRLLPLPAVLAPDFPVAAEVSPDGHRLVVTSPALDGGASKGLWLFRIDVDGTLHAGSHTPTGNAPVWPAILADGRRLYVSNEDTSGEVFGFDIATDGGLTPLADSPFPAGGEFSQFQSAAVTFSRRSGDS